MHREDELVAVVSGHMEFTIGGDRCVVQPGDELFIPPPPPRPPPPRPAGGCRSQRCLLCVLSPRMLHCMFLRSMLLLLRSLQAPSTAPKTLERAMHTGCMGMPKERLARSGDAKQASWLQSVFACCIITKEVAVKYMTRAASSRLS